MALKASLKANGINDCAGDTSTPLTLRIDQITRNTTIQEESKHVVGIRETQLGPEGNNGKPTKYILVSGDHGAPLEMWSNALVNYVTGVTYEDGFRFKWVEDDVAFDWARKYVINNQDGSGLQINYNLVCFVVPRYKAQLLTKLNLGIPLKDINRFYFAIDTKTVYDANSYKLWGRDMAGSGITWSMFHTAPEGGGNKAFEFMAKHADDLSTYDNEQVEFLNPDSIFYDHEEAGGKGQFENLMQGFHKVLSNL